jgi:hypothetical protein
MTQPGPQRRLPTFLTWYGSAEVFDGAPADLTQVFTLSAAGAEANEKSTAPPLIIRAYYNLDAYRHIRDNALFREGQLRALAASGSPPPSHAIAAAVVDFPRRSVIVKTAWWPVPQHGVVALPVWDPALNPPMESGNDYPSWARVVAVSTGGGAQSSPSVADVDFMGTTYHSVRRVDIGALFRVVID